MNSSLVRSARPAPARISSARPLGAGRRTSLVRPLHAKGGEEGGASFGNDVYGTIASNANFMIFGSAMQKAGLDKVLTGEGPFTVFAADDDAMNQAAKELGLTKLEFMNHPTLVEMVKNMCVAGKVDSGALAAGGNVTSLAGFAVPVSAGSYGGKSIQKTDIPAGNGILHKISAALI